MGSFEVSASEDVIIEDALQAGAAATAAKLVASVAVFIKESANHSSLNSGEKWIHVTTRGRQIHLIMASVPDSLIKHHINKLGIALVNVAPLLEETEVVGKEDKEKREFVLRFVASTMYGMMCKQIASR
jgi:hypothetical protein